jgi:hypothetical protein
MITVVLKYQLGNALFQYAVGRHLAIKNKTTLRLNLINYLNRHDILGRKIASQLDNFRIAAVLHAPFHKKIARVLGINLQPRNRKVYYERQWGFDSNVLLLEDGVQLHGFFQSEKYFKDIEHIIRNDLQLKRSSLDEEAFIYQRKIMDSNSVSVHVRRGKDYLSSDCHIVCNMNYYIASIRHMQDRLGSPRFFVFSDDIEWCLANMRIDNCSFVHMQASRKKPITDFQLMRLCKHNIIANSTFSWWAAWLNDNPEKIVVAPNKWFKDERPNASAMRDTIPEDWIRINF